jgi:TonB-linked SusC/RagA family outer membrane protein
MHVGSKSSLSETKHRSARYGVEAVSMFYSRFVTRLGFVPAVVVAPVRNAFPSEVSMRTCQVVRTLVHAAFIGTLAAGRGAAQTPQQGTITGRVTDAASGAPVAAAQINVVGTTIGAQASQEGQFTIRGVNPGNVELRVLRVGFAETKQSVTVTAGQTVTADIRMRAVVAQLAPIVTTATGEQRRIEVGNAIAQVDAAKIVETQAVSNIADVLVAKAPGVMVIPGTQTGAGVRIRIRGTSSLSLTNNPIYVIDGIRVEGGTGSLPNAGAGTGALTTSISVGGTTPSRAGDLNPEEIESIEIVRGPSASTLYGTDAANGVIVITTKKGVAGRTQWTYYTEQAGIRDLNNYPTAFWGWRTGTTAATTSSPLNTVQCFLSQVAAGTCVQDSVTTYNLHDDKESTPYGTGYRQQHGLQARGGTELVRYFLHGEYEDEDGATKVPEFEQRYMATHDRSLTPKQESPNHLTRMSARSNFNIALGRTADLAINAGYISQDLRLPQSDDSGTDGIAANVYGGPGFKYNLTTAGDTLYGWRQFTPRDVYQQVTTQSIERVISSAGANWRPREWFAGRANFGVDYINRLDTQICRFSNCPANGDNRLGFKRDNRTNFFVYTLDAAGTATRRLATSLESKTTAGVQFGRNVLDRSGAVGTGLTPGATTVTGAANKFADEATTESRTLGGYLEENLAFRDRLFLTAAVRSDRNSAFGADFETVFYPKLALSWVISDESFFPQLGFLNQLRLRSAYGASGVQPGTTDAVQFYSTTTVRGESGDQTGVTFTTIGNRDLKPERSTELELGVDGTFWNGRLTTELTYYNKVSKDALINRTVPPSLGLGNTQRFENVGEIKNAGVEMLVNAQILRQRSFGWDVTVNGSMNDNELVSLGPVPPIIGTTQSQIEGYPLNGWWSRIYTGYEDKNGDGIISATGCANIAAQNTAACELFVTDTNVFLGYPTPKREFALSSGIDVLNRRLRLSGLMDYKGGHKTYNNTERIRCASRNNCAGLISKDASFDQQARVALVRDHPSRSVAGFFEDGDFIRLREVSLSYTAPEQWAARYLRGRSLIATAAVRNIGVLWTKYSGVDPEAFGTTGDAPSEFQAFAPPTYFTFRLNLGF